MLAERSLLEGFFKGLAPVKRLTVSEWADANRVLTSVSSAEPGQWRTSRTPYLKQIMDNLSSNNTVEEIIVMKGAQIGMTEAALNLVGYCVDMDPCPLMYVLPTVDTVKRNSKTRIDPMIQGSKSLSDKIKPARSRDAANTILQKDFPGGTLILAGANSAPSLRNAPIRVLILDEVDAYPLNLDEEGSPIELAKARTRTFSRRKIFMLSTPVMQHSSVIEAEFLTTDQRYWFVPCIHCNVFQTLVFENLIWEKGKPETTQYVCPECGAIIEERFKTAMLDKGEWRATVPANASHKKIGYHLNSLYSPYGWYSWQNVIEDYEKSLTDVNKMKTFTNTVLGKTWTEKGEAPAWENLYNKRETYAVNKLPDEVCFLTAGVDIQKDRIELEIVGWSKGKRSYSIDYRVLLGETSSDNVWIQLSEVLNETWTNEGGTIAMPIRMMSIDTGYNSSEVYAFCRKYDQSRVIPIKGRDNQSILVAPPRAVDISKAGKAVGTIKVWNVGVSMIKSELYGWLGLHKQEDGTIPTGYCYFPQYDQHYFRGLTAEQLEFKIVRGFRKYEWVKKYERNEPLDCRVYARAAAAVVGIDRFNDGHYDILLNGYKKDVAPVVVKPKRKSDFWGDT